MSPWTYLHLLYLIPLTHVIWVQLHEHSHVWMADRLVGVLRYTINPWPRRYEGGIRWASVSYYMVRSPEPREEFWISMAPRLPSLVALTLMPLAAWWGWGGWVLLAWVVLWGGGVVDMFTNSLGLHPKTDLRKAAEASGTSPWIYRVGGMAFVVASVGALVAGLW